MPSKLKKIDFPYQDMKLKELFYDERYSNSLMGADTEGIRTVFGRSFAFEKMYKDRPYVFNSLVTSIDGKIAFEDASQGPLIAKKNKYAGNGGTVDYWILNVLRGSADAIFTGTASINKEAKTGGTGHCYDEQIEIFREQHGKNPIPLGIVVTMDGLDINYEAAIFHSSEKPLVFYSTEEGYKNIASNSERKVNKVTLDNIISISDIRVSEVYVIVSGNNQFDHKLGMKILKNMGIDRLLVESPTVTHFFMKEKLMDELFLNYSCVYVGGKATSIGMQAPSFTSEDHPHTKLVSVYMYNNHFIYLRHRLIYE